MLTLHHLTHSFGTHHVLHDLDATIADGTFCAIVGPNGCGKTTLLRCIGGLLTPTSGYAEIDGLRADTLTPRQMAHRITLVSQHSDSHIDFTAEEIVLMARYAYLTPMQCEGAYDLAIAEEAMRATGTWHLRHRYPVEMSGGEWRRVMIARALAQQTPTLLLDEPLSNLDIVHQFEIMHLLTDINRNEGKTILIVVHDLQIAYRYCPQVMVIANGHIDYHGATNEGLTHERIKRVFGVESTTADNTLTISPAEKQ